MDGWLSMSTLLSSRSVTLTTIFLGRLGILPVQSAHRYMCLSPLLQDQSEACFFKNWTHYQSSYCICMIMPDFICTVCDRLCRQVIRLCRQVILYKFLIFHPCLSKNVDPISFCLPEVIELIFTYVKTKGIRAFVLAAWTVQFLFFLNPKIQASSQFKPKIQVTIQCSVTVQVVLCQTWPETPKTFIYTS